MAGRSTIDRVIHIATWLALVLSVICAVLLFAAESAGSDVGLALALPFMVLFYLVSIPLHLGLGIAAVVRGIQAGLRNMAWVYVYLGVAVAGYVVIGARIGAFESLERDLVNWQREQEQPAQVALERALRSPGNVSAVRAALAAGADPDAVNPRSPFSLLNLAAGRGEVDSVDAMLRAGADPNRRSTLDSGVMGVSLANPSPLDAAAFGARPERLATVQRLLAAGADASVTHARLGACYRGDLALLEVLSTAGAPDVTDRKGNGCLHLAAARGHAAMVQRLLDDGADPNALNTARNPPLDAALARRQFRAALVLARNGGRPKDAQRLQHLLADLGDESGLGELQAWIREQRP